MVSARENLGYDVLEYCQTTVPRYTSTTDILPVDTPTCVLEYVLVHVYQVC
jgi:hypothetical protein